MVLEHPDNSEMRTNSSQHYLGDGLLVGQNKHVYLPAGHWVDYWTGRSETSSGAWRECDWPEPACGPLWVRAGSIIITGPVIPHALAENESVLVAEVFPGEGKTVTRLYDDDGISLAYRAGDCRITEFTCRAVAKSVDVTVHCVSNTLSKKQDRRAYLVKLHTHFVPTHVAWKEQSLAEMDSYDSLVSYAGRTGWCRDAHGPYVWIKVDPHRHFTSDGRGAGDPECDTPVWSGQPLDANGQLRVTLGSKEMEAVSAPSEKVGEADSIRLMLNPPERIALEDGSWLSKETTVYAWLEGGGQPVLSEGIEVILEVLSKEGNVLRTSSKPTIRGRAEFPNEAYIPGNTVFRVSSEKLESVEATVRTAPPI